VSLGRPVSARAGGISAVGEQEGNRRPMVGAGQLFQNGRAGG
jgi:hypothetical protein